ncbi:MAG TPA: dihydrolipoyl dehydrogenase [Anaerolineae bacterium]|nr:dihydrolipoyl dehydrogenase [Anaerolineae bacterium]HQI85550.1 dihydrolipoyl dehydrogenase [Anaerolineae bacterium]
MVMGEMTQEVDVVVVGGGPGGYAAAFRAADLGLDVALIEKDATLGGVCLNRGCIPSKTLLHVSQLLYDARHAGDLGLRFAEPEIDLDKVREFKDSVVSKLTGGLDRLAKQRGVQVVRGTATFESSTTLRVVGAEIAHFKFKHAIIATGSSPITLPGVEIREGGRIMDSTGALALPDIPERLLVIGGGYVGLELGSFYATLGSRVTVVEMLDSLIAAADADLARPLLRRIKETFKAVYTQTKVTALHEDENGVDVTFEGQVDPAQQRFDRVLVAVGRRPNSKALGLENTRVELDARGFIRVDAQQRTADPHIFAVGDVVGGLMLAHKAMREGKVAAEVIAGQPAAFDVLAIPAVVYTDPQLAWAGLTENEARAQQRPIKVARFPWSASGRALTMDAPEGMTKIIADPETGRVLGFGIVGREAGEMIAEGVLAIEMGALAEDVALTIHAHPTLSETEGEVAELFLGSATHILPGKR